MNSTERFRELVQMTLIEPVPFVVFQRVGIVLSNSYREIVNPYVLSCFCMYSKGSSGKWQ